MGHMGFKKWRDDRAFLREHGYSREQSQAADGLLASAEYKEWAAQDRWQFSMGSGVRVFVERDASGSPNLYFSAGRETTQALVNTAIIAFSRRQRDAGVPLWWPEAEEHLDKVPVIETGSWKWNGPGDAEPGMLGDR